MKWSFLLFSSLFCLQAFAQYPATGNKARLGWQTTADGLVYRGAIGDTTTLDPSGLNNAWMLLDTASGNLYAYRAKAWRLVSGGGGGGGLTMPFDSVTFNVNEADASLRELKYSEEKGYLQYGGQDSVQIPILPGIWYVRNDDSVTISKGMVLRASGTLGASGRIKVKRMIADGSIDAMYILGIAMHDIAVGADGYAMSQGKIRQVNTQAYSEGAVLYADVDTLGGLTQTEPGNGFLKLPIAFVVHSASNGTIAVRVTSGAYMRDLHDVEITSPATNASLYYNTAQGIWRDTTGAVLTSDTSVFARDFQISGTTNYLAKFTGSNVVGNSVLFEDANGDIGAGTTDPTSFSNYRYIENTGRSLVNGGVFQTTNSDKTLIGQFYTADGQARLATNTNHRLALLTNNTQRMLIDTGGNVGIGVSSPVSRLHINGLNDRSFLLHSDGSTYWYGMGVRSSEGLSLFSTDNFGILFGKYNSSGTWTENMRITNGGNVGIGVSSPVSRLHINGLNDRSFLLHSDGSTYWYGMGVRSSEGLSLFSTDNFGILFGKYNSSGTWTENMRITSAGNVGIATASPSRPLHINATTAIRLPVGNFAQRGTSGAGDIRVRNDTANLEFHNGTTWQTVINNSDTSVFARDVQISGTANRLAMFTGANAVGNSAIDVTSDTVSIRDYSNSYTTWRFHSNINKRGFIGYPAGTRFYSLVNPSVFAGFMYGDRSAGVQDQQAFIQLTAYNGGGAASGFFSAATTLNGADSTLYFNISGLSANANPTFPAAQMAIQKGGNVGINTTSPSRRLHVEGEARISDLTTDPATRIVGADADGDLDAITIGNGVTFASDTLKADTSVLATKAYVTNNTVQTVYIPINLYAPGDTVANTTNSKAFFMVHSGLNGYCIDSYTVKAISGSGTADIQIDKNGSGANAQSISGTTVATKDTNIALATGDYIRGQVFNLSGTLVGLGLTLEIKKTCN